MLRKYHGILEGKNRNTRRVRDTALTTLPITQSKQHGPTQPPRAGQGRATSSDFTQSSRESKFVSTFLYIYMKEGSNMQRNTKIPTEIYYHT